MLQVSATFQNFGPGVKIYTIKAVGRCHNDVYTILHSQSRHLQGFTRGRWTIVQTGQNVGM